MHKQKLPVALDLHYDFLFSFERSHRANQVLPVSDGHPIDAMNHVATLKACFGGGTVRLNALDHDASRDL